MKTRTSKLAKAKAKPNSKYWRTKADAAWSKVIRISGTCAVCGASPVEAHHLINRSNHITRHSLMNGIALCALHHKWCNKLSAHGAPIAFAQWLETHCPEHWEWVSHHKNDIGRPDYQAAYEALKAILDSMEKPCLTS